MKTIATDGALLSYDRQTGFNVLVRGEATRALRRTAPRVLQVGLLTPCNLACDFCYRDTKAPSRWTVDSLATLLRQANQWGVLEVAFGGGEPLLFRGFTELVQRLQAETTLGVNFTTNGVLLTDAVLAELGHAVGEIRVSAYRENRYRSTLRRLAGRECGLNLLVTPENVGIVEPMVQDALALGARNVLLLGYKGEDARYHLSGADFETFRASVRRLEHLPLRLDVCWHPRLADLPHLFARPDCGAGDEFLVLTPDRAVQPCSFHHERIPFDTFDDLRRIYSELQQRRPAARVTGCTRREFVPVTPPDGIFVWQARASNNSGDYTIIARFESAEQARAVAESLRQLARRHEEYVASYEFNRAVVSGEDVLGVPSPVLQEFGRRHGFEWEGDEAFLWWEAEGFGAPVLTAGAVGESVVVYHPYAMGMPYEPLEEFFARTGATHVERDRLPVHVTAEGGNAEALLQLRRYSEQLAEGEFDKFVAPWGEHCEDPRVGADEDREAGAQEGFEVSYAPPFLLLRLLLRNVFAGSLAIQNWLRSQGFSAVRIEVERPGEALPRQPRVAPDLEAFRQKPLDEVLAGMSAQQVMRWIFTTGESLERRLEALDRLPGEEAIHWGEKLWRDAGKDAWFSTRWREVLTHRKHPDSVRALWQHDAAGKYDWAGWASVGLLSDTLPEQEVTELIRAWIQRKPRALRWAHMSPVSVRRLSLGEDLLAGDLPGAVAFAVRCEPEWETLRDWLSKSRQLRQVAVSVLDHYVRTDWPAGYIAPSRDEFLAALADEIAHVDQWKRANDEQLAHRERLYFVRDQAAKLSR